VDNRPPDKGDGRANARPGGCHQFYRTLINKWNYPVPRDLSFRKTPSMPSLFRNAFFTAVTQGWQMVMALILFKTATVGLGETGFGIYTLAMTLMYFVLLFDDFGVTTLVTRDIARRPADSRSILARAMGFKLLLIPLSLAFLAIYTVLTKPPAETSRVIWIVSLYGLSSSFTQLVFGVFRAHERMQYETLTVLAEKTLSTALCVGAIRAGFGLIPFSLGFALAGVVSLILSLRILARRFHAAEVRADAKDCGRLLRDSLPFGMALFVTYSYGQLAIPILRQMRGDGAVGLYGAAQKLMSFTNLVPMIFATAFFPRLSAVASDKNETSRVFTLGMKYIVMLAVPLVPGVLLTGDRLILLFADARYAASAGALFVLAFAASLNFFNVFLASLYNAVNRQRLFLAIEAGALAVNIGFNILLIRRLSFMGAAWTTLITEAFVFVLSMGWALARLVRITEWAVVFKVLAATGFMTAFLAATPRLAVIPAVLGAVGVYALGLLGLKALSIAEIRSQWIGLK
jgi:O-antigen/teichoic acid export membrane protein